MEVVVARIGRPHGVRGEVSVEVRTDDPEQRLVAGSVLATDPPAAGPLRVRSVRHSGERYTLGFVGIEDREAAEGLRGVLLVASSGDGTEEPDAWYDHQLVGLAARHVDGRALGTVVRVEHGPQDRLVVRLEEGRDVEVPFVMALVPEVDVESGSVTIDPPGGLLEGE